MSVGAAGSQAGQHAWVAGPAQPADAVAVGKEWWRQGGKEGNNYLGTMGQ